MGDCSGIFLEAALGRPPSAGGWSRDRGAAWPERGREAVLTRLVVCCAGRWAVRREDRHLDHLMLIGAGKGKIHWRRLGQKMWGTSGCFKTLASSDAAANGTEAPRLGRWRAVIRWQGCRAQCKEDACLATPSWEKALCQKR